ncbi:hypothetical protein, partial [Paraburkholderia youngii]|uniref:hypothetical protein n=1 Tax=Paraburkholderia youngii TaxID=2782701 RepID=UPI001C3DD173
PSKGATRAGMLAFTAAIRDRKSLHMCWSQPVVFTRLDQRSLKATLNKPLYSSIRRKQRQIHRE